MIRRPRILSLSLGTAFTLLTTSCVVVAAAVTLTRVRAANVAAAVVFGGLGLCLLTVLAPVRSGSENSRSWLPMVAFFAGPLIAAAFWAARVFVVAREHYALTSDYFADLPRILSVGILVGVAAALALTVLRSPRKPTGQ